MSPETMLLVLLVLYFLPTVVASERKHRNRMAITMLNILLGWTLLGWVIAMVWACTADVEKKRRDVQITPPHDGVIDATFHTAPVLRVDMKTDRMVRVIMGVIVAGIAALIFAMMR
jgi:Superinfection immunity protein